MHFFAMQNAPQMPISKATAETPISTPNEAVANLPSWSDLLSSELKTVF